MAEIILSESQYLSLKKNINSKILKEDQWYNTVMDVLGIFDPTPVIDIINALSYWKQGDTFYAVMSFLSAIPYGGDFVGKSAMYAAKSGGKSAKMFKEGIELVDSNPKKANEIFAKLANGDDAIAKLIKDSPDWGPYLIKKLDTLPKEMSGISQYLSKVLTFFQKNSVPMKWAYSLTPDITSDDDDTSNLDYSYSGEATSDENLDTDPLSNLFGDLFSGKLNYK